jgi:hypothetical protein
LRCSICPFSLEILDDSVEAVEVLCRVCSDLGLVGSVIGASPHRPFVAASAARFTVMFRVYVARRLVCWHRWLILMATAMMLPRLLVSFAGSLVCSRERCGAVCFMKAAPTLG